jgi:hypothetical protein
MAMPAKGSSFPAGEAGFHARGPRRPVQESAFLPQETPFPAQETAFLSIIQGLLTYSMVKYRQILPILSGVVFPTVQWFAAFREPMR